MTSFRLPGGLLPTFSLGLLVVAVGCSGGGGVSPDGSTGGKTGSGGTGGKIGSGGAGGQDAGGNVDAQGTGGRPAIDAGDNPAAQCKTLVDVVCARANGECKSPGTDAGAGALTECVDFNKFALGCDRATQSYATCLADSIAVSCAALVSNDEVTLPNSCAAPIQATPPSPAQLKCHDLAEAFCNRSADCAGVVAPNPNDVANCVNQVISRQLPCPLVTGVGPSYDMCLTEVKNIPCPPSRDGGAADAGVRDAAGDANPTPSCQTAFMVYGQM